MAVEALRRSGTIVARHTCEAGTTFDDLIRGLMRDMPVSLLAARAVAYTGDPAEQGCVAALPAHPLRPLDVVELPQRLDCRSLVCVVDEFDRVQDAATRVQLADLIKQLSDSGAPLLFLIVGVSDNLDQILGQHPSIQRAVIGVHLPLFNESDVAVLIARAGREIGIVFPAEAMARITVLARGMPYMVQLLGLRLAQAATARDDATVLEGDFREALTRMIDDAGPRVATLYAELTAHASDTEMVLALRRLAGAPQDPWGRLSVVPDGDDGVSVGGRPLSAACWARMQAARLLLPAIAGSALFVFAERGLMYHALLLAARDAVAAEPDGDEAAASAALDASDAPRPRLAVLSSHR